MLTNNILSCNVISYYPILLSADYSNTKDLYSPSAEIVGNSYNIKIPILDNLPLGEYTTYNGYTIEIKNLGYAKILGATIEDSGFGFKIATFYTDREFANSAYPVPIYISKLSVTMQAAFSRLQNDIVYGVKDIEDKLEVKGIIHRVSNANDNILQLVENNIFDESLKHLFLYMVLLQQASLSNNDVFIKLSRHHYRQYLDYLDSSVYYFGNQLAKKGYTVTNDNIINTVELARI